tara:strand:- start:65 stop:694 length:630 start_codon:yes stop_codon:yes gene_type:complete
MVKYMEVDLSKQNNLKLKTYKKNLKFIENFEAIDTYSGSFQEIDQIEKEVEDQPDVTYDQKDSEDSEQSCSVSKTVSKKSKNIEGFLNADNKDAANAVKGLVQAAQGIQGVAKGLSGAIGGVISTTMETLSKPEFQEQVKKQVDVYTSLGVDSVARAIANPDHQHKVEQYIVKPFWDLYVIPFIDMYVIFLILYYVIFMITMIWISKSS